MPRTLYQGSSPHIYSSSLLNIYQLAPGDDLIMSNMYSLLNYIAATSKEIYESSSSSQLMNNPLYASHDHVTLHSVETGLRGLSEDEKRLVGISTISVVTRLALEFHMEEVTMVPSFHSGFIH
jgi:phosphatidylinositol 4-kinase